MRDMTAIPDAVYVDGERIDIVLKHHLGTLDDQGHEVGGLYLREVPRIVICGTMTLSAIKSTLLHELGHHAFERSGLSTRYAASTEEKVVEGITHWLYAALQDKGLQAFLFDRP
jgi:hypothetical protein